jgi:hypothetical protein
MAWWYAVVCGVMALWYAVVCVLVVCVCWWCAGLRGVYDGGVV